MFTGTIIQKRIIAILLFTMGYSASELSASQLYTYGLKVSDSLYAFLWTQAQNSTKNYGYYGVGHITTVEPSSDSSFAIYSAKSNFLLNAWWKTQTPLDTGRINLTIWKKKPAEILQCSKRFESVPWLCSIGIATGKSKDSIRFHFPILPMNQEYNKYDYYSVKVNDSVNIDFQMVADSVITGSFVNSKNTPQSITKLYAKNTINVFITSIFMVRIKNIQINASGKQYASDYMGLNLSKIKGKGDAEVNYYGIEMLNPKTDVGIISTNLAPVLQPILHARSHEQRIEINYAIPAFTQSLRFTVYDVKGRGVVEKKFRENSFPSSGTFYLPGSISNGYYLIQMQANVTNSQKPITVRKTVVYLH